MSLNNDRSNVKLANPTNILVTSIAQKVPLLREVRVALDRATMGKGLLYGGDTNQDCIGKYFVDVFWHMPLIKTLLIKKLITYCHKNNISMIIPTRDAELPFFAKYQVTLTKEGIQVMISNEKTVKGCLDKYEFYLDSQKKNYSVIPTFLENTEISNNKVVVKERYGAGSRKLGLGVTHLQAESLASQMESPIYQPYREGLEVSIDAYVDKNHNVKGVVMRKRDLVVNGESQITTLYDNPALDSMVTEFLQTSEFYGHIMLQVIVDKHQKFHIIECNPRFGGASTLSIAAGLDSFYWFIQESLNNNIDRYPFKPVQNLRQIRYKSDLIQTI